MSKVKFSPEQQQLLRDNPYTVRVTADVLSLSREFKEIFYKEYLNGALPRDILQKYGYPIEILGVTANFVVSALRLHPGKPKPRRKRSGSWNTR